MKIKVNDIVLIRTGRNKGKTGKVTKILQKTEKIVVDGINEKKKNIKGKNGEPGQQVTFFAPIHVSNVGLIDPELGKATRIRYKKEGKNKLRIAIKSGKEITRETKKVSKTKNVTPKTTKKTSKKSE